MRNISRSILIFFLSFFLSWTLAGVTELSAEESAGVSGALRLPDVNRNCDGVTVGLEQPFGIELRHTHTDWLCNFAFNNLEPGVYYIHVGMPGYLEVRQPVHVEKALDSRVALVLDRGIDPASDSSPSGSPIVDASEILRMYPEEAVRLYKESIESRRKGKAEEAARQLERALSIAPEFYAALNDLGLAYQSLGRFDDAGAHLWKAHAINSNSAAPLINLGALYLATGDLAEAVRVSNMAVEADSHSALAFFNLGMALYRKSDFQQAENAYLKTLSLAPSLLVAHLALTDAYVKMRRLGDAAKQLDLYLEKAPECPQRTQAEHLREKILLIIRARANY